MLSSFISRGNKTVVVHVGNVTTESTKPATKEVRKTIGWDRIYLFGRFTLSPLTSKSKANNKKYSIVRYARDNNITHEIPIIDVKKHKPWHGDYFESCDDEFIAIPVLYKRLSNTEEQLQSHGVSLVQSESIESINNMNQIMDGGYYPNYGYKGFRF